MKLRSKLTILVLLTTLTALCAGGGFFMGRMREYTLAMVVESEQEKLTAIENAFQQVGTREDFENMGELARDAYLKYQFERCYGPGYALLKGGESVRNLTDYEIVCPEALAGAYMVQKLGEKHVLLLKKTLEYPAGFEVLAAKDISDFWDGFEEQVRTLAAGFLLLALAGSALTALAAGRLLKGLGKLKDAAEAIGAGELGRTVEVKSYDEIGLVAEVFNRMSLQVAAQVEDLQLLLGALAHEMKTPVTSIIGYADSLLHVRLSEEQQARSLRCIYDAGRRMETMSAKFLALLGTYENDAIEKKLISVEPLLTRLKEETRGIREGKQIVLSVDCQKEMTLLGDEELLFSLLTNLVQNSCKASEDGGRIEVKAGGKTISVTDFGCGIPRKDLPNVTKAFYMADKSRSRSEGGSGLGLALAERIMALHGGVLEITSQEGEGTTVSARFP